MSAFDELSLVGDLSLMILITASMRVLVGHLWCYYGRMAFVGWIALGILILTTRIIDYPFGLLNAEQRSLYAGIGYDICAVHVLWTAIEHILAHREEKKA